jgi:hypothetical protein
MIRLPTYTFLNGPNGCGKSTLASLLTDRDTGLCHCSFASPIRMALMATFYPDKIFSPDIDLRNEATKASLIPGTNVTHRRFMIEFGKWMRSALFNPYIFADIAKRQCESLSDAWPRFIFDDCRFPEEPAPFSLAYGEKNLLIITIERQGTGFNLPHNVGESLLRLPGASHVALSNNRRPEDMLSTLESVLGTFGPSGDNFVPSLHTEPTR